MTTLSELKTGDIVRNRQGHEYIVHRVRRPKRNTGIDEPFYRLERTVIGTKEWTLNELQEAGVEES